MRQLQVAFGQSSKAYSLMLKLLRLGWAKGRMTDAHWKPLDRAKQFKVSNRFTNALRIWSTVLGTIFEDVQA
jgi:hypothetical protein